MAEQTRTLLIEYMHRRDSPLEEISYSVINNRLVAMGGSECNRVEARKVDDHYLLMRANTVNGFNWEPFGIVDSNKPNVALDRIYDEAKRLAKETAKRDGNKVIDLTSRAGKVVGNDRYYVPDRFLARCA